MPLGDPAPGSAPSRPHPGGRGRGRGAAARHAQGDTLTYETAREEHPLAAPPENPGFALTWTLQKAEIAADALADGLFPLLTNDRTLPAGQLLTAHESKQPLVEKRHDLLKNVEAATPVHLKSISRIEALCVLFIALLVHALIWREVRATIATGAIPELPLYPEDRTRKAPSAARILEIFSSLQRHDLLDQAGRLIRRFDPDLMPLQTQVALVLGSVPERLPSL